MGRKYLYPTSAQLDAVVLQIYRTGIAYTQAVLEFKKQFILTALRDANWNETKAARALGMHRNTLARALRQFDMDIRALRKAEPRPRAWCKSPKTEEPRQLNKHRTGAWHLTGLPPPVHPPSKLPRGSFAPYDGRWQLVPCLTLTTKIGNAMPGTA
jgi:hypothetical protein